MKIPVSITSVASVSALGKTSEEIWQNYLRPSHQLKKSEFINKAFAGFLPEKLKEEIKNLRSENANFRSLDDSVLYAVFASREAVKRAGWRNDKDIGINIGSSRGATGLFEKYHKSFLEKGKAETLASPSTTLGNISSWVQQDLENEGPEFSHSVTCSTGLHAVVNGIAWLQAEFTDKFLVGGSEAALTPFTIAQMQAMKIYASEDLDYPCQALNMNKSRNSMVLGEGAGIVCMETGKGQNAIAQISGIGYATEKLKHSVSISSEGECLQKSMKMAMQDIHPDEIDAVVTHAPGTLKGDLAEVNAINAVFGEEIPAITSNKWKLGHTFGASGVLSMEMAILMLQHQEFIPVPFSKFSKKPDKLEKILVNAVGFGGNAVSVLVSL
ncbi:beta-ketoacyl synthase N-terminal-like domain-containing protein [Autumnicola musiva]|uniref:Beta-ketoacyl synthase N-terminal-like domain-containing protein n=1 Tax=Autumnicola musiva TaxID=3075589 RepID=A0ABU3D8J3_9FLAO|nr:beta-ketoacyl synthase N-terminal-like domain-containing protein [Zunongwangia sp. F117]MDT0677766.1 beta-ketoacyl synthase N-terminal-like domain-containing protein [Zunongwangia sp. F117]